MSLLERRLHLLLDQHRYALVAGEAERTARQELGPGGGLGGHQGGHGRPDRPARAVTASYFVDSATLLHVTAVIQEFLWHRLRRVARDTAVADARDVRVPCVTHPISDGTVDAMVDLVESTGLRGRDALHAASALEAGSDTIVTPDRGFLAVSGLRVVHPSDVDL